MGIEEHFVVVVFVVVSSLTVTGWLVNVTGRGKICRTVVTPNFCHRVKQVPQGEMVLTDLQGQG